MKTIAMFKEGKRWRYIGVRRAQALKKDASDRRYLEWWSTQAEPSKRRSMCIRKSPAGTLFFAYKGDESGGGEGNGGESLHHFIYKTAIASLGEATFQVNNLPGQPIIPLRIVNAETEKHFTYKGQSFYADIFIEFSNSPEFELRWGGKLAVEIIHTSKTPQIKRDFYEEQGITVLEVKVSERVLYRLKRMDLSNYGEEEERLLIEDVVRRFSKEPIFTYALVDSLSQSWLIYENWANELSVSRLRAIVARQNECLDELRGERDRSVAKQRTLVYQHEENDAQRAQELKDVKALLQDMREDLADAHKSAMTLRQSKVKWVKANLALMSILLVLLAYELIWGVARPGLDWVLSLL